MSSDSQAAPGDGIGQAQQAAPANDVCFPTNVIILSRSDDDDKSNSNGTNDSQESIRSTKITHNSSEHLSSHLHNSRRPQRLSTSNNQLSTITHTRRESNIRQEPINISPSAATGLLSPLSKTAATTPEGAFVAAPVRRLSRIEHKQSLSNLGYGKIESYFKLQRLGKGTYATVYMGRSRLSNDLVALKEILKEHDEGAPCTAIREVSLLRNLKHNNIVTLHDICHTPEKLTLVFEYVGPDLYAYMKENNHLLSIHNVRVSTQSPNAIWPSFRVQRFLEDCGQLVVEY